MKNFKCLFVLSWCFMFFSINCSSTQRNFTKKEQLVTDFLNYYFKEVLKTQSPVILDSFTNNENEKCMLQLAESSPGLGFKHQDFFREPIKSLHLNFSPIFFSEAQLPNNRRIDAWIEFRKKYPKGFFVFPPPIVNDDLNRIIFCYGNYCGDRCGNGVVVIYEKGTNGKWKMIKKSCEWNS